MDIVMVQCYEKWMITNTIIVSPLAYNMELPISKPCPVVDRDSFNQTIYSARGLESKTSRADICWTWIW